jgi:hypothetical protein
VADDEVPFPIPVRIDPGPIPHVRVSCAWLGKMALDQRIDLVRHLLRRVAEFIPRMTHTLSNEPKFSIVLEGNRFRKDARTYRDIPRFAETCSITLRHPETGETETVADVPTHLFHSALANARARLAARVYVTQQTESQNDAVEFITLAPSESDPKATIATIHYAGENSNGTE